MCRPKIKYLKSQRLPVRKITERRFTKCESPLPFFNHKYGTYNIYEDAWKVYYNTPDGWFRYNEPYRLYSTAFENYICLSQKELSILRPAKQYLNKVWRKKLDVYERQQSIRNTFRLRRIVYHVNKKNGN